jgi:SNF2 family DNA or RNA helicase
VSIVDFVDRFRLGPTFRFLDDHQVRDEFGRVVGYRNLDRIGQTLAPILVRRRKADVLKQLPERLEKRFYVPMTPQQMAHHEENRETVAKLVAKWRRHRFLSEADQRWLMIALQNMRMACDSTYLLDGATDHGVKADELMTVFEELFERPDVKAVVFSQWVKMHGLLSRRIEARRWKHVFFHGGVESRKRQALVDRFREDPECRVFLSTDAGGVGLNLQHASVVVNVDLPWNPAVLEQRIGRVHRLGQTRPVQVVSFVAKGTIEEGMLTLLGFKRSLFAGILDGGEREVFLGGSRLNRFMESVEKATATMSEPLVEEARPVAPAEASAEDDDAETVATAETTGATGDNPLADLLRTGLQLFEQFRAATVSDERTGERYLKIKMPEPEVVGRVTQSLQALLESLRRE